MSEPLDEYTDPVLKRIARSVREAEQAPGMRVGTPKVRLETSEVRRLLRLAALGLATMGKRA